MKSDSSSRLDKSLMIIIYIYIYIIYNLYRPGEDIFTHLAPGRIFLHT